MIWYNVLYKYYIFLPVAYWSLKINLRSSCKWIINDYEYQDKCCNFSSILSFSKNSPGFALFSSFQASTICRGVGGKVRLIPTRRRPVQHGEVTHAQCAKCSTKSTFSSAPPTHTVSYYLIELSSPNCDCLSKKLQFCKLSLSWDLRLICFVVVIL